MTVSARSVRSAAPDQNRGDPGPPSAAPVVAWATVGAISLAIVLSGWGRWIVSGDPGRTPNPGPDTFTGGKLVFYRTMELSSAALAIVVLFFFVIRPLFRDRRLGFDGMLILGTSTSVFYDACLNYYNFGYAYNTHALVQFGSWANYVPGFSYPNMQLWPWPAVYTLGAFIWWAWGLGLAGCWCLTKLRSRFPSWSILRLFGALFVISFVVDVAMESLFLRSGIYAYPSAPKLGTLWAGQTYQLPFHELFCTALYTVGLTAIRWFRDDQGRSIAERGIDQLRIRSQGLKRCISCLAIIGAVHAVMFVYLGIFNLAILKSETSPPLPSYLRAGICGEGTNQACPGKLVPVPRRGSVRLDPADARLRPETGAPKE